MKFFCSLLALISLTVALPGAQAPCLVSGEARLMVHAENGFRLSLQAGPNAPKHAVEQPLILEVDGLVAEGHYEQAAINNGTLNCEGTLRSRNGTHFHFHDRYRASALGAFELTREVEVSDPQSGDVAFNTGYRIGLDASPAFTEYDYFVPAVWYRTNFAPRVAGNLASDPTDQTFLFREDRLPLPIVAARDRRNGDTVALIHTKANPTTFAGDKGLTRVVDERLQFASLGVRRKPAVSLDFLFPGSEGEKNRIARTQGWAYRSHPVRAGVAHRYQLTFAVSPTASYPEAIEQSWKHAFDLYRPVVRPVDIQSAFDGLVSTLDHYAVGKNDGYDAPGFPFSVILPDGKVRAYNYQMGFIGRQIPNAFTLLHEGIDRGRNEWRDKGADIVDFWSRGCLASDGLPRTWYDPSREPNRPGRWRSNDNKHGGTAIRVATTGMEGMLAAWGKMSASGQDRSSWLATCRRFGDWLVANQNEDGSFYLAYGSPAPDGRRVPTEPSKATSTVPIRFLVLLYQATHDERYLKAAIRTGEYCLDNVHAAYFYAGCVIDNPVTIDRESGQEALTAFLALRDTTKEPRWLDAAVQAARYTETWMIAYEIPPVEGAQPGFPVDRSVVGQTLIATGQSAADLGLAFSACDYYRLYLFTGDEHFLTVARILLHNTKQALNWDQSLYPELPKGLQLEAFSVSMPRRNGVMECLSWNYAAHLDPLIRLKNRFGSLDLEAIERLPQQTRRTLNE